MGGTATTVTDSYAEDYYDYAQGACEKFEAEIRTATDTADADYPGDSGLRQAFENTKVLNNNLNHPFNELNAKQIIDNPRLNATTVDNYDDFEAAYTLAKNHMAGLVSNNYHYNSANVAGMASVLNSTRNALVLKDVSLDSYNAIVADSETELTHTKKWTADTRADLQDALDTATSLMTQPMIQIQSDVDSITGNIRTAYTALDPMYYTVNFNLYVDGSDTPAASSSNSYVYGTELPVTADTEANVYKWVNSYDLHNDITISTNSKRLIIA